MDIVREAAGNDQVFLEGLAGLAKRDAVAALQRLHEMPVDPEAIPAEGWITIAEFGRKLAVSASVVSEYNFETAGTPA